MIFGDHLLPPDTVEPAAWIAGSRPGEWGTVGSLVPNRYPVVLQVRAPDPVPGDWWSLYRDLYEIVASIGARHTSTPDRAWFAVWEGHGFDRRAALDGVPRFDLPHRTYYLLEGPVAAVTRLRNPDPADGWRNPDLFWPDDRRWFVATDVDFWSLYIGGDDDFIADLDGTVETHAERVTFDHHLESED